MSSSSASESLLLTGEKHQLLSGYQGVSDSGAAAAVAVAAFNTQDVIHVQFDQDKGPGYAMCSGCIVCSAASSCVCLVCLPCVLFWAKKEFHAQECSVDDKRIHYKGGWVNKKEKTVPLDRVQDLEIQEGLLQRYCGVSSVLVQTAGANNPNQPAEITLVAPMGARELRAHIIQRRDAIVLHGGAAAAGGASAASSGIDGIYVQKTQPAPAPDMTVMVNELRALRESVSRIEKTIEAAVNK